MKYTGEQLDSIAAKLRELPAVKRRQQEYTKQAAVGMLIKEITALQKRGYELTQIAEALRGEGLDITTPTLKNYLMRVRPIRKKSAAPKGPSQPAQPKAKAQAKPASFPVANDTDDI